MNQKQNFKLINLLLTIVILTLPMFVLAQEPTGGGELDTPIDGGLSLLVAAGVGYGAKKIRKRSIKD